MSRRGDGGNRIAFGAPEAVLEAALEAILTIDAAGVVLYLNRAAEEMFALERDDATGRRLADLIIPPDLRDRHRAGLERLARGEDPAVLGTRLQMRGLRSDGAQFPIELTVTISSEEPRQYTGFIRDLSVLKHEERERVRMEAILSKAEQMVSMGSFELNVVTGELTWSDGLYRINGFEPGEVEPTIELAIERMHPEDREMIRLRTEEMFRSPRPMSSEYRIQRDDGEIRHVVADGVIERDQDGDAQLLIGTVRDVTDERLTERDLQAHYALTKALSEWHSFEEGVVDLLRRLGTAMEWELGAMWVQSPQRADLIVPRAFWSDPGADLGGFEQRIRELSFERGVGAVWKVWEDQRPLNVVDLKTDSRITKSPAREEAIEIGISSGILFPALHEGETLAVLSFAGREPRMLTDRWLSTLESVGGAIGRFFARRRAEIGLRTLSPRELEVIRLAADGLSAPLIAERLMIGAATVKTHFTHVYEKLGVTDRAAAVAEAMRRGLID